MNNLFAFNYILFPFAFLLFLFNNNVKAQINCETFKQVRTGDEISTTYAAKEGGKADLWGPSFLDIFVTDSNEIFLACIQPDSLYIEKYDAQLNLITLKRISVIMNKFRSYYGVIQLGKHLYILFTEKTNTGTIVKNTKLYLQEIDTENLELIPDKIDILNAEGDLNFERSVIGSAFPIKSKLYIAFSENNKYMSLIICPQVNNYEEAEFIYKVLNPDLTTLYEGNVKTPYKCINISSVTPAISNNGEFAFGLKIQKKYKTGAGDYEAQVLYFTNRDNLMKTEELENATGYAESLKFLFLDNKLCVDLVWQNFEDKLYIDYNKLYIYDLETGRKIKEFPNMLFDFLPAEEASAYGKETKHGYNSDSREFILYAIQSDPEGNIYLSYIDFQFGTLAAMAYVKLDKNYKNLWAHLFYFTKRSTNKLIFKNSEIYAYGSSYAKVSAAAGSDPKSVFKSQTEAQSDEGIYRFQITFSETGTFEIHEMISDCEIPFKDYKWIEGGYFPELNTFLYYGRPEGTDQPEYLFKFGY